MTIIAPPVPGLTRDLTLTFITRSRIMSGTAEG